MISSYELFEALREPISSGRAFVAYTAPKSKTIKGLIQKSNERHTIDDVDQGFVFASYDHSHQFIIPDDDATKFEAKRPSDNQKTTFRFFQKSHNDRVYLDQVQLAIDAVRGGSLSKVVLARYLDIEFEEIDIIDLFKNLVSDYVDQFVYLWSHSGTGIWLGATPEVLLERKGNKLKTTSLAGTQKGKIPQWSDKEIDEQQIVTDFIISEMSSFSKEISFSEPKSIRAGDLWHLKTSIKHKLIPELSTRRIINRLHPTPAVCGVPRKKAKSFIQNNEALDRAFYTGYLGEYNMGNRSNLYVNLRCIQLHDTRGRIYVGAGITQDSEPILEWQETQNKANIILKSLS